MSSGKPVFSVESQFVNVFKGDEQLNQYFSVSSRDFSEEKGDFCNIHVPRFNQGYILLILSDFPVVCKKKRDEKSLDSFFKEFSMKYRGGLVFCVAGKEDLNLFQQLQLKFVDTKFVKIEKSSPTSIGKFVKTMFDCNLDSFKMMIKKIQESVATSVIDINEIGSAALQHIPKISETHGDFLLQEIGSIGDIAKSSVKKLRRKTPLSNDQINTLYNFFH